MGVIWTPPGNLVGGARRVVSAARPRIVVPPTPVSSLEDRPVYDPSNPDHVLHWDENLAGYTDFTTAGPVGTNPNLVGPTLNVAGAVLSSQIGLVSVDDGLGGSGQVVQVDSTSQQVQGSRDINVNSGNFVSQGSFRGQLIWECVLREVGQTLFPGKYIDWSNSAQAAGGWRWDFNNGSIIFHSGEEPASSCELNHLCRRLWSGPDNNTTPLFPGLPPDNGYQGASQGAVVRFRQLASAEDWCTTGDAPLAIDGRQVGCASPANNPSSDWNYYQNRNWGLANGQWDLMQNRFADGAMGALPHSQFLRIVWSLTRSSTTNAGFGRWEAWVQPSGSGINYKVVEYYGDVNGGPFAGGVAHHSGLVFTLRSNQGVFGGSIHYGGPFFGPFAQNTSIQWGQFRCWSRTPFSLAA